MTDKREDLAKLLHESMREAVAKDLVVNKLTPKKPFVEWWALDEAAKEGRRLMAQYLLDHTTEVRAIF